MSGRWEQIGVCKYWGGAIAIAIGLDRYVITATDAPDLVDGACCDIWQEANPPFVVGRASWSDSGRMVILSLPGGLVQVVGRAIVNHYIARDKRPCAVIAPPAPEPMAREPTRDGMVVRAV